MRARVLGSAAGGGFPQWNCGCPNCAAVRRGDRRFVARTQDSLAVFAREDSVVLCNVSPDVARQIEETPALHPRAPRHTPIAAVVITNGDLDHVLGLFSLREAQPLAIYATAAVQRTLVEHNAIAGTLARFTGHTVWRTLELERETELAGPRGEPTGIRLVPFAVPGKLPIHLARAAAPSPEDTIGLVLRGSRGGKSIVYVPGAATPPSRALLDEADVLLFDGTFWASDELVRLGLGSARAEDMAHLPIGGTRGALERLAGCRARRRIFTHINNTNPVLAIGSPERLEVERAGWEVAYDGMEILP